VAPIVGHQLSRQAYHSGEAGIGRQVSGTLALDIALDPREFAGGRWWSWPQIRSSSPALFDPNMGRFLAKIRSTQNLPPPG
jgi:hypothetical protein